MPDYYNGPCADCNKQVRAGKGGNGSKLYQGWFSPPTGFICDDCHKIRDDNDLDPGKPIPEKLRKM